MISLPEFLLPNVPIPESKQPKPLLLAEEARVCPAAPAVLPETMPAFSAADDMDFDIVSTRASCDPLESCARQRAAA